MDYETDPRLLLAAADDCAPDRGARRTLAGGQLQVRREETEARRAAGRRRGRVMRSDFRRHLPRELAKHRPRSGMEGPAREALRAGQGPVAVKCEDAGGGMRDEYVQSTSSLIPHPSSLSVADRVLLTKDGVLD